MVSVDALFQLIGVQFEDEDDVVVFAPGSGEVLRFASKDWKQLKSEPFAPPPELKAALIELGSIIV